MTSLFLTLALAFAPAVPPPAGGDSPTAAAAPEASGAPKGLTLLRANRRSFQALGILAPGYRAGGWLYNPADNDIPLLADVDGDRRDDVIVTSPWGIGAMNLEANEAVTHMLKPNGTRFGGWNWQTADNTVQAAGDFDGDRKEELVVTSGWGIGLLELDGDTFGAVTMASNGTRFGGWNWQTADNTIQAVGDVDGDGKAEMVVTSGWGIGVLELRGSNLDALTMGRNGTRFGGWNFNSANDTIHGLGDLDGDGEQDLVVTSPWGFGVLTVDGSGMDALTMSPNGTRFGGWNFNSADNTIQAIADFDGDGRDEILVTSPWGVGVLGYEGGAMTAQMLKPNGTWFDGWNFNSADNTFPAVGDLDGDGAADIVVRSGWGLGHLSLRGDTFTAVSTSRNGTAFGGWTLEPGDRIVGASRLGRGTRVALLVTG